MSAAQKQSWPNSRQEVILQEPKAQLTAQIQPKFSGLLYYAVLKENIYMPESFNWLSQGLGLCTILYWEWKGSSVGIRWLLFVSLENKPFRIVGVEMSMVMNFPTQSLLSVPVWCKPFLCFRVSTYYSFLPLLWVTHLMFACGVWVNSTYDTLLIIRSSCGNLCWCLGPLSSFMGWFNSRAFGLTFCEAFIYLYLFLGP